jgi:hypothetical protein
MDIIHSLNWISNYLIADKCLWCFNFHCNPLLPHPIYGSSRIYTVPRDWDYLCLKHPHEKDPSYFYTRWWKQIQLPKHCIFTFTKTMDNVQYSPIINYITSFPFPLLSYLWHDQLYGEVQWYYEPEILGRQTHTTNYFVQPHECSMQVIRMFL